MGFLFFRLFYIAYNRNYLIILEVKIWKKMFIALRIIRTM